MKQAGVWSFRTQTGVARVVNGRLRSRYTLRGFVSGTYSSLQSTSLLRSLAVGFGAFGLMEPIRTLVDALAQGSLSELLSVGVASMIAISSMMVVLSVPVWSLLDRPAAVDIYDIRTVTVDESECELTIKYVDDESKTTTITAYDADELDEAVEVLELKGAPVETN